LLPFATLSGGENRRNGEKAKTQAKQAWTRKNRIFLRKYAVLKVGGGIRIRTLEGIASRFTVCPV
jgi:hypothetical protein